VSTLQNISVSSVEFVDKMKNSMNDLTDYISTFKSNITDLSTNLNLIGDDLSVTLIADVNEIKGQMYCTFVADSYADLTKQLCEYMMPAFLMISLFLFLMGIFLIPVIICLIILAKRLRRKYTGAYAEDNKMMGV
jgi:hypothetical protein